MLQANPQVVVPLSSTLSGARYRTTSLDPVVAEVHAIRAKEWEQYGENSQAWFDALLYRQAQRMQQSVS